MIKMNKIQHVYKNLFRMYGAQGWWPLISFNGVNPTKTGSIKGYHPDDYDFPKNESEKFEICIGALLVQNTSWLNTEKALIKLKDINCFDPFKMQKLDLEKLKECIKSAGYFNQKARKIKVFTDFFISLKGKTPTREELLLLWGVGMETADSILLYAYKIPIFVIDAYTKRFFTHLGVFKENMSYELMQRMIMESLVLDCVVFQEYHALIVEHAKRYYFKKELYDKCPIYLKYFSD